jgi:hypothetical protein
VAKLRILARAFGIELAEEGIEALLLLQVVEAWRPRLLLGQVHAHGGRSAAGCRV